MDSYAALELGVLFTIGDVSLQHHILDGMQSLLSNHEHI